MSITFCCPAEPEVETNRFECDECDFWAEKKRPCVCKGTGWIVFMGRDHDVNMANGNARIIFNTLGIEFDYCGVWGKDVLADVRRRCILALNTKAPNRNQKPLVVDGNFCYCALSGDDIKRRIERLLALVTKAQELNSFVSWS